MGSESGSTESDESRMERERILAIRDAIVKEDAKRKEKLRMEFAKNPNADVTKGRCCLKWTNEIGAYRIHTLDIVFFPNIFRWIFAIWARVDEERFGLYARVRLGTFYLFWLVIYSLIIGTAIEDALNQDYVEAGLYINSLVYLSIVSIVTILDYHYCQVILYCAETREKREMREERIKSKKERAE